MKDQPRAGVSIHRMTRSSLILRAVCGAAFDNFATREFDFASTKWWGSPGGRAQGFYSKKFFKAKRYMDDILTFYVTNPRFNHEKLLDDFKQSQCYWPPLHLENANNGIF